MSNRPPLFFRKHLGALRPADRVAEEAFAKVKPGEVVRVEMKRPRNAKHHRKYWALLALVVDNLDQSVSVETLHDWMKLKVGCVRLLRTKSGLVELPGSISFEKMDQSQFEEFYEKALQYVLTEILPGVGKKELEEEVFAMIGGY